jgi:hypothetical protein
MRSYYLFAVVALFVTPVAANSQPVVVCNHLGCSDTVAHHATRAGVRRMAAIVDDTVTVLRHPFGCPPVQFCACGAAVDLWGGTGRAYKKLWAARTWYRFPRSTPSRNTVAVRRHHVMVLKSHVAGSRWLVADYNSGRHQSRMHVRDISGYVIVDPGRSRIAAN